MAINQNPKPLTDEQRMAFTQAYRLYEKWSPQTLDHDAWMQIAQDARSAYADCGMTKLAEDLIVVVINALWRESDERDAKSSQQDAEQIVMTDADGRAVI